MMEPVRKHSLWVWLAIIVLGWALLMAAPKVSPHASAWLKGGYNFYHTGR